MTHDSIENPASVCLHTFGNPHKSTQQEMASCIWELQANGKQPFPLNKNAGLW